MREAKLVAFESYRGYRYYIEVCEELYYWYFMNDYILSIAYACEDSADSAAKDCIDSLIIEIEES